MFTWGETKNQRGVWASDPGKEVEKCKHSILALDVELMERYPFDAASKTLSMLALPKRLAVRTPDYSVSILSLSFISSLSVSILSSP